MALDMVGYIHLDIVLEKPQEIKKSEHTGHERDKGRERDGWGWGGKWQKQTVQGLCI